MKHTLMLLVILAGFPVHSATVWQIGAADGRPDGFALAPAGFDQFVGKDFGFDDTRFVIGFSDPAKDFPYALPGPADTWGGTWGTSGWRCNQVNLLFDAGKAPQGAYSLRIGLVDFAKKFQPLVKVTVNGIIFEKQLEMPGHPVAGQIRPSKKEPIPKSGSLTGDLSQATPTTITVPIAPGVLRAGGNCISIEIRLGSWIIFDHVTLEGTAFPVRNPRNMFVRDVSPAAYELANAGVRVQPLVVDVEHLKDKPSLTVELDGKPIFTNRVEQGRYQFEAPMPAVATPRQSNWRVLEDGKEVAAGTVERGPQRLQTAADYVDTRMGTAHSRWMIAPGPWMPFGMVKISPDNQNAEWQGGYDPMFVSVGTFSHIHEWTLGGLGLFASSGPLVTTIGDDMVPGPGYRSPIDPLTEEAPIGLYRVNLLRYGIKAEVTATTRCSLTRFSFPADLPDARVLVDFKINAEKNYQIKSLDITAVSDRRIEGQVRLFRNVVGGHQDYTVHFVMEFDQPMRGLRRWVNDKVEDVTGPFKAMECESAGLAVAFDPVHQPVVQVRTAISLVSTANAALNLKTEITDPFGWDFDRVRQHQVDVWNELFDRIRITTDDRLEKSRFYNCMYRSLCGRTIWSDVNGEWTGCDGKTQRMADPSKPALGSDALWNTFWNLNQFWNLVTPEWSSAWAHSELAMYKAYGWLAKGPAGMNYVPIMVGEHEIPLIVGAWQMGIRDFDAATALEAMVKMQTTPAQKVGNGFAGNNNLEDYLQYHYMPYDKKGARFSNGMEYSYDDWTVGQFAKALGRTDVQKTFENRGTWWRNSIDPETGYCRLRDSKGVWAKDFDPIRSGANKQYVEASAWQMTYFVPQDVPGLISVIGRDRFLERLVLGFDKSDVWRFNGLHDQYWDCPVDQGDEQTMQLPFLFNWAGRPDLTQYWSREVIDRYYGMGNSSAYLGDEDQGQMSAWLVMAAMGLFQTDGGCRVDPIYELGSPIFPRIEIDLGHRYGRGDRFVIEAHNASRANRYVQSAVLNGQPLKGFSFPASEVLKGGSLILEMGDHPNNENQPPF